MKVDMKVDTRELQAAMQLYARATKQDEVEIVNRAAKWTLYSAKFGAVKHTKSADLGEIDAKMNSTGWGSNKAPLKVVLAAKKLKGKGLTDADYTKSGRVRKGSTWQRRVSKEAKKIHSRRRSSAGYLKAGWKKAAVAGGWDTRGPAKKYKGRIGYGIPAKTRGNSPIFAKFGNLVRYSGKYSTGAPMVLQRAIRGQARDMAQYARKKMSETARKYSSKAA